MKKSALIIIGAVSFSFLLFFLLIYTLPFKKYELSEIGISLSTLGKTNTSYVGLYSACKVLIINTHNKNNNAGLAEIIDSKIKPYADYYSNWVDNIGNLMYSESYFYTIDFDECDSFLSEKYPDMEWSSVRTKNAANRLIMKVGGMVRYKEPLSHANKLIMVYDSEEGGVVILLEGDGS